MAKKIRFPLIMDNGVEIRTPKELRDNFSIVRVLEYFNNGKLIIWLKDRAEDGLANQIEKLDDKDDELVRKICSIFEVPYDDKIEENIQKEKERNNRINQLLEYTQDNKYISNIDYVAFDQDELYDLLDEENTMIYLCGANFYIPLSKKGVTYEGINNPEVIIDSKERVNWCEKGINLISVRYNKEYLEIDTKSQKMDEADDASKLISGEYKSSCISIMLTEADKMEVEKTYKLLSDCINSIKIDEKEEVKAIEHRLISKGIILTN